MLKKLLIILIPIIAFATLFTYSIIDFNNFNLNLAFVKNAIYNYKVFLIIICIVSGLLEILICAKTSKIVRNIFTCFNIISLIIGFNAFVCLHTLYFDYMPENIVFANVAFIFLAGFDFILINLVLLGFIIRYLYMLLKFNHLTYDNNLIKAYNIAMLIIIGIIIVFSISYKYYKKIAYEKVETIVNSDQSDYEKYKNIFEVTDSLFLYNFNYQPDCKATEIPNLYQNQYSLREGIKRYQVNLYNNELVYNINYNDSVTDNYLRLDENGNIIANYNEDYTDQQLLAYVDQYNQAVFNNILQQLK